MAVLNNDNASNEKSKEYATDEAGMMRDAKEYAKRDYTTVKEVVTKIGAVVGLVVVNEGEAVPQDDTKVFITEEALAKALISVKYMHVKNSRTNRSKLFD